MKFLSDEQNARFAEVNARCGLGPEEFTAHRAAHELAALPATRIMSSTGHSDFPPHIIPIGSVEELRKLVGLSGAFVPPKVGSEPDYPAAPAPEEIAHVLNSVQRQAKPQVSQELKERIDKAAIAYVVGNPEKVAAYVPLINALQFPGRVAVFTGETLDVPPGASQIITGDDPVVLNYGKITVAHGASIKVKSRAFISAQLFSQEPGVTASADPTPPIVNIGEPWDKTADQGGQGPTGPVQTNHGANGVSSYNSGNCQYQCSTQPGNGPAGNDGGKGLIGGPGAKGHPSAGGIYNLGLVTSPITMLLGGGDGQQGGKGGIGGAGGSGGAKGTAATGCANNPTDGPQGRGGQGGDGGPGGPGGESGFVTVYYSYNGSGPGIQVTVRTVGGGAGGLPGDPGPGNGNNGSGKTGTPPGAQGPIPKYALNKQ